MTWDTFCKHAASHGWDRRGRGTIMVSSGFQLTPDVHDSIVITCDDLPSYRVSLTYAECLTWIIRNLPWRS